LLNNPKIKPDKILLIKIILRF